MKNDLTKDYDKIKALMDNAASLLKEANDLAKRSGTADLQEYVQCVGDWETTDVLFTSLDSCGWRTSSLVC